jgi:FkbM family methyltransferase
MSECFVSMVIATLEYSDTIALDIGAAEGKYMMDLHPYFSEVYGFEAAKEKIPYLLKHFKPEQVINKAISDKSGTTKLYKSVLEAGCHTINGGWKDYVQEFYDVDDFNEYDEVEAITIDEFCEGKNVSFIKCDIEGGEAFIFNGAVKTLRNNKMDVVIELHPGIELDPLKEFFTELGYKIYGELEKPVDGMVHYLFSNRRD